jgi:zinc protease
VAPPDPAVVQGRLANGLRYYLRSNAKPTAGLSIRLYFETGSLQETEAERGGAHFLEHMAFEGGKAIPREVLNTRFQEVGVSMERDRNAFTTVFGTFYVLDLQEATPAKLDTAFTWLRDVADGLTIDQAAVDQQRGVVMSEYLARRDGGTEVGEAMNRFVHPNLRMVQRSPGGTPESLKALTAETLRNFYQRWYRPERAFIVVVGDQPVEALRARVEATFGTWKGQGPAPVEADPGYIDFQRPSDVFEVNAPNFAQGVVEVCRLSPPDPQLPPGVASWRRSAADAGWAVPLQQRLNHLARSENAPFVSPRVEQGRQKERFSSVCLVATPKGDKWRDALNALADETHRLDLHGITDREFNEALGAMRARLAAGAALSRTSAQLAQGLMGIIQEKEIPVDAAIAPGLFDDARKGLTPSEAQAAFRMRWVRAAKPLLVLVSTTKSSGQELRDAWVEASARPDPGPQVDTETLAWKYSQFGPPGKVVSRREISEPSFIQLQFANGVKANIKTLTSERDRVEVRVRFGAGQLSLDTSQMVRAYLGSEAVIAGGLGKHDSESLERLLDERAATVRFGMDRDHFTLSGNGRKADAGFVLQALAAFATDPGFRTEGGRNIPSAVRSVYTSYRAEPLMAAQKVLRDHLPGPPVFPLPEQAAAEAISSADIGAILKPILAGAELEVTIVGDIDEASATAALASTFGALAPRQAGLGVERKDAAHLNFPDTQSEPWLAQHSGLSGKAGVVAVWPLFVWEPARQREVRALTLLREVLSDRVRKVIREKQGQTYTPEIQLTTDRGGDQGSLAVAIETSPATIDQVSTELVQIGQAAGTGDVTAAELERVRKPLLDDTAHRRETAGWWLNTMDGSQADPYRLAQARTWQRDYSSISVDEVNRAARNWFAKPPLIVKSLPKGAEAARTASVR